MRRFSLAALLLTLVATPARADLHWPHQLTYATAGLLLAPSFDVNRIPSSVGFEATLGTSLPVFDDALLFIGGYGQASYGNGRVLLSVGVQPHFAFVGVEVGPSVLLYTGDGGAELSLQVAPFISLFGNLSVSLRMEIPLRSARDSSPVLGLGIALKLPFSDLDGDHLKPMPLWSL